MKYDPSKHEEFKNWKQKLEKNLLWNKKNNPELENTIDRLIIDLTKSENTINILEGEGYILTHRWSNGEYKHVAIVNDAVVGEDNYWLARYPFLSHNKATDKYMLPNDAKISEQKIEDKKYLAIMSHNGHYGHFIADDLPRLQSNMLLLHGKEILVPSSSYPNFAERELQDNALEKNTYRTHIERETTKITGGRIIHPYIEGWALRSYILHKLLKRNKINPTDKISHKYFYSELIFVRRSENFGSRISNIDEIQKFLESIGFTTVCFDGLSLKSCRTILEDCKLAVAECGTTTLITAITLKKDTPLISLQPRLLFQEPTEDMLKGGAPYIFMYNPDTSIILGNETKRASIQTSSICHYEVDTLVQAIRCIANKKMNYAFRI